MNEFLIISFSLAFLFVSAFHFAKLIDWNEKRKLLKYKNAQSEFNSDCYKLQQKWASKGESDFAAALGIVIEKLNIKTSKEEPQTEYGRQVSEQLKKLLIEETFNKINEDI